MVLVETEKPDLIYLTEVLPKSYSSFDKFYIPGFILFDNFDLDNQATYPIEEFVYMLLLIYRVLKLQSTLN